MAQRVIRKDRERREWLLRCQDDQGEAAVCTINVNNGVLELLGPGDEFCFQLEDTSIADFRAALDAAIARAEADLTANPGAEVLPLSR
ncbi:hypothetical protein ACFXGA_03120 [Actinosynnema sp. NPDC059335]|uniref:hypothetical protein n=1 Tax=Actinosynnema sp. NPDC059335 TaxID=3346804 RepID=UPI00366EB8AF